jgi:hypothetical protein
MVSIHLRLGLPSGRDVYIIILDVRNWSKKCEIGQKEKKFWEEPVAHSTFHTSRDRMNNDASTNFLLGRERVYLAVA